MGTAIRSIRENAVVALPVSYVIGPTGQRLTLADLPKANTSRWVMRRKAEVVAAVEGGLLSLRDACARYSLSPEEFLEWENSLRRGGLPALRVTPPRKDLSAEAH